MKFLSTPSGWRATLFFVLTPNIQTISIHALRVEGDAELLDGCLNWIISIHALRVEGDLLAILYHLTFKQFLSTPSGWRATITP